MKKFLLMLGCAVTVLLSGCTKSTIVNNAEGETIKVDPNKLETVENVEIDWDQVKDDASDIFTDTNEYEYAKDFMLYLEPESKELQLLWIVDPEMPGELVDTYAEDLLKEFNDVVAMQDSSIEESSETSYGGLWDTYSVSLGIIPEGISGDNTDEWFLDAYIPAGTDFTLPNAASTDTDAEAEAESSTEG